MANAADSASSIPPAAPLASKENTTPINARLADLNQTRLELSTKIQGLKQDLQNFKSKLDSQVKTYRDELLMLKKSLNFEVDQLRSEFQELRTTLQEQHEDVATSLKSFTDTNLQDAKDDKDTDPKLEKEEEGNAIVN